MYNVGRKFRENLLWINKNIFDVGGKVLYINLKAIQFNFIEVAKIQIFKVLPKV